MKGPAPRPTPQTLHEAAIAYLARYAASAASLRRVLRRRVERWRRGAGEAPDAGSELAGAIDAIVARLTESGAIDDAGFASRRARSLAFAGKSRRASLAHLRAKGIDPALAAEALPQGDEGGDELGAALLHCRRRRLGAFGPPADEAARRKALASLARAGFSSATAARALAMERTPAEQAIARFRASLG